jgi:integrase
MPKIAASFIEREIRSPKTGQSIVRDTDLKGFGVRATSHSISFIVECRVNGRVRRVTLGKYEQITVDQARMEAQKYLLAVSADKTQCLEPRVVTLNDVLKKFLEVRKLRPQTIANYSGVTKRCLTDWLDKPVTAITKDMIQERHQQLTRTSRQGTSGEAQANQSMRILKTLLNFAANNYETSDGQPLITVNPVSRLSQNRSWHIENRRRLIIPDDKLGDFYRAAMALKQKTLRDYLILLLLTGLRRNEAATLRWSDIDFEARTITISPDRTKNKHQHCLPLTDFLMQLLCQRKRRGEYVFPSRLKEGHIVQPRHALAHIVKNCGMLVRASRPEKDIHNHGLETWGAAPHHKETDQSRRLD